MSFRRLVALLLAAVLAGGCMSISSTLTVRPDGSGTLTERLVVPAQFAQMMRSLQQMGDSTASADALFTEGDVQERVDALPGMRLESVTMVADESGEGYEAVYAFNDLSEVRFDPAPDDVLPRNAPETGDGGPFELFSAIDLSFTHGSPATLTLRMPHDPEDANATEDSLSFDAAPEDSPTSRQEMEMMREMMQGSGVRLAVQIEGDIVETNATHRSGSTVTLIDIDFGKLARDSTMFSRMMGEDQESLSSRAALDSLNAVPGVIIEHQETVTIRFR